SPPTSPLFPYTTLFRSRFAGWDSGQIDLDAHAAACRHFRRGRRQTRGTHVLNGDDVPRGDQLEARFEQQLFRERIADLDLGAARSEEHTSELQSRSDLV